MVGPPAHAAPVPQVPQPPEQVRLVTPGTAPETLPSVPRAGPLRQGVEARVAVGVERAAVVAFARLASPDRLSEQLPADELQEGSSRLHPPLRYWHRFNSLPR